VIRARAAECYRSGVGRPVLDVAIIGTGFGGLAMARALQREGTRSFRFFEKAAAIGGTWRDNTYPGAACDVPSHLYSLSDAPNPEWSRLFPAQEEIRAYLDTLAAPFLARGLVETGFRLARAEWIAADGTWRIDSHDGRREHARALVLAMGGLHQPAWSDLPGREDFAGASFHTARWRHDVDLGGKRVAVIGTGASAVQVVPAIVDQVAQLHVVQRTPPWILPRPDHAIPAWLQRAFRRLPILQRALRGAIFMWLEILAHALLHPRTAFWARALARRQLKRQVPDAGRRVRLSPSYPIGCKRVLLSSDFYPALVRPHCTLVDRAVARIDATGLVLEDGTRIDVDVIVHATGFRPMDVLRDVEVIGRDGRQLSREWSERPTAHLGIGVHGFPNLFLLLGPNTALGHNSALYMIESQVEHVMTALAARDARQARGIEPTQAAQRAFIDDNDRRFPGTAWAGCRSWYLDAHGRNIALWIGSALGYRRRTRRWRDDEHAFSGLAVPGDT
jgi:cation diffusion facilitator CzcD-associated flavoprotein CzcO